MAYKQRTGMSTTTQSILTDDPDFLRLIVERDAHRLPQWLQVPTTAHPRRHTHRAGTAGSGRHLLYATLRPPDRRS